MNMNFSMLRVLTRIENLIVIFFSAPVDVRASMQGVGDRLISATDTVVVIESDAQLRHSSAELIAKRTPVHEIRFSRQIISRSSIYPHFPAPIPSNLKISSPNVRWGSLHSLLIDYCFWLQPDQVTKKPKDLSMQITEESCDVFSKAMLEIINYTYETM